MIATCLNPTCRAPFSYAHEGRIFTVDRELSGAGVPAMGCQKEQYWLCETCCKTLKVVIENGCITTVPIEEVATPAG